MVCVLHRVVTCDAFLLPQQILVVGVGVGGDHVRLLRALNPLNLLELVGHLGVVVQNDGVARS